MITLVIKQVTIFLIYIVIGVFLKKAKILPENSENVISKLLTCLILPVYSFSSMASNVTVHNIKEYYFYIIYGLLFIVLSFFIGCFFSIFFAKKGVTRNLYKYMFTIANFGYFGYPFVEGVFGTEVLANMLMFCLPTSIFTLTIGLYWLCGEADGKGIFRAIPAISSCILGVIFGLLPFNMPSILNKIFSEISISLSPFAMILLGLTIGSSSFLKLFSNYKAYILAAIRLLVIPAIVGAIFWLIGGRGYNLILPILTSGMPIGMNVVIFLQEKDDNTYSGLQYLFITIILSIFTIPLLYFLMTKIGIC